MNAILKNTAIALISGFAFTSQAQTLKEVEFVDDLPCVEMIDNVNIMIISPEPIQFVDLSTNNLVGDLPADNIARIKINDSQDEDTNADNIALKQPFGNDLGIITIVTQSFMAQYKAVRSSKSLEFIPSNIYIQPKLMQPLEYSKQKYSNYELKEFSQKLIKNKTKKPIRKEENLKLIMKLNNIYVMEDYIFLDITIENKSNLACDLEDIKFSVEDKKIYKATNNQSFGMNPIFALNDVKRFRKSYRNIFVFEKFTFPNSKVLNIRIIEEQVSGRIINMRVNYSDVLQADTF
ncbi:MAG: DUF4138 domain-containing protein [Bacteroidota bacterium]|nr:DUF4138 domain-containing protein [Bacteroidota bacterium]